MKYTFLYPGYLSLAYIHQNDFAIRLSIHFKNPTFR